jgi:uncharacterized protein (TIGR02284 family)
MYRDGSAHSIDWDLVSKVGIIILKAVGQAHSVSELFIFLLLGTPFLTMILNFIMETLTSKQSAGVLADLIKINNDRIEGYEKALKNLKPEDNDLRLIFLKAIDQSRNNRVALGKEIQVLGEEIPTGSSGSGSIHRAWLELKATFSGHSRHALLASCEFGEDAAQKAYESALEGEHLTEYLSSVVLEEKQAMKVTHNEIKALRDKSE